MTIERFDRAMARRSPPPCPRCAFMLLVTKAAVILAVICAAYAFFGALENY